MGRQRGRDDGARGSGPSGGFIARERARVRRFLGSDLPERALPLRFDIVIPTRCKNPPPKGQSGLAGTLDAQSDTPIEALRSVQNLTRLLNRCAMPAQRRLDAIEILARRAFAEILPRLRQMADQGGGIPEQASRAELLDLFTFVVSGLRTGYQILFAIDYARSRFWYAKVRDRVHLSAARILELIKLQHRINGLRYSPLPPEQWRIANTVYVVMRAYESTNVPQRTLTGTVNPMSAEAEASLDRLYAAIQTYRILDYSAWPENGQFFIDDYCRSVDGGIVIRDFDRRRGGAGRDRLVAACWQDGPPLREPPDEDCGPAVVIDYRALARSIRLDYVELTRARADRNRFAMPPRLADLEPVHQTSIAYLLHRNLRVPWQWGDLGSERQRHRDLRIYTGYDEVRAHLSAIFAIAGRAQQSRELSDLFARRSAVIGEDDTATKESLWYVLYETEERMRIKTQETRFTNRMFIGNLLAYGYGEGGVCQPRIGKANRIYRPEPGTVVLDVEYLASFGTPATIYRREDGDTGEAGKIRVVGAPQPAVLMHHPQRGWGIITPPQERFWEHTPVGIQTGRHLTVGELEDAQDVTAEFCWFAVSSRSLPDKAPDYPDLGRIARPEAPTPVG